ncbi:MAG: GSCFA domain-containing protein [Colwellia sp.]|jgi:hypothetical protein|uniref:GSCFA domain-containing protein n=1 Tax=Colwellia sp. Bg11-12 TaxID=2759817 RepID=UPI0015F38FD8|nr:GSCFA domain-containing protein [Colwellia sp. Bg11-12]MBA6264343.1 GSCFA domain-containing protein [Colwellia sp. Bg11-12]
MSTFDSAKITPTVIEGIDYLLKPNADKDLSQYMEVKHNYRELARQANKSFTRQKQCLSTSLQDDHIHVLRKHFPEELCQSIIEEYENNPDDIKSSNVIAVLLPQVFNQLLDEQVISYFNSEYCIFWWSIYKINDTVTSTDYSCKWHCDAGPKNHLKVLIYLNGIEEHGSDTSYLSPESTQQLKDVGYIFNDIKNRETDLSALCQHFDIDFTPKYAKPNAGDTIIFNPNQIAHRALPTKGAKPRYVMDFCLLQNEVPWRETVENDYVPVYGGRQFEGFANKLLKFNKRANTDSVSYIEIPQKNEIKYHQHVQYLLNSIFSDQQISTALFDRIKQQDTKLLVCTDVTALIYFCKNILQSQLNPDPSVIINKTIIQAMMDLADYQLTFKDSYQRYSPQNKPNPNGIFWPNPDHAKHPQSQFEQLPYVKKTPIMTLRTPIGSAGSCFAFEISKYFQENNYNYVVTERNDSINSGLVIDGYQPGDSIAKFCANYGILFNSPSFSQLAEKAFGLRSFEKLLIESEQGVYLDPYRENVFFRSQQAYLEDYDRHIAAVKSSFLNCEVFVVTMGLNECWELHDGTVMSRNPRENMFQLVKHKILTVEENVFHIQRFFDIIKAHNPDFKLIISVSPVPFLATGRADEHHIITANVHSKAVLLVAAEKLVANNADMYYLPSYELVTQCEKEAWHPDRRHVKSEVVARVVSMFEEIFVK